MARVPDFTSLNGPDNVGKTTHLVRLAERWDGFQPLGAVHEHDPEPWARVAVGDYDYARWWFEMSTTVELTELLLAPTPSLVMALHSRLSRLRVVP